MRYIRYDDSFSVVVRKLKRSVMNQCKPLNNKLKLFGFGFCLQIQANSAVII